MTIPAVEKVFLDTNILVYATLATSAFHSSARDILDAYRDGGTTVCASNQVLREFLACTTRPGIMAEPLSRSEALDLVVEFRDQFQILADDESVGARLIRLLREVECGGKQVHDANIVATMLEAEVPALLTANQKDFRRFESYISIVGLTAVAES